ncbi:MAG: hypothetical protein QG567_1161 [Campylobacterota bacterium]|nr:hypothetical protein [Campylobacterota bacterium]
MRVLVLFFLTVFGLFAMDANEIIKKMDSLMIGKSSYTKLSMSVETKRTKRTMVMEAWSEGNDKSFIRVLYPQKDKDITFLKIDNAMWQFVPKIEKTIKIPPSMMLQSWMGSDFTNDDMIKESSIVNDYHKKIISENEESWTVELMPKEDAAVVWGKIIMNVHKEYFMPLKVEYFDEEMSLARELFYSDFKKTKERTFPHRWEMIPKNEEKKGNKTTIIVEEIKFDIKIDKEMFTKRALKL